MAERARSRHNSLAAFGIGIGGPNRASCRRTALNLLDNNMIEK